MKHKESKEESTDSKDFKPYIAASDFIPEFTPRAIIMGAIFGILFGAATVYLGLRVGLTVSASIPIAVIAISIFKKLGNATILESNIVQTIGSAGESVAAGVVFTVPALLFLPGGADYFHYFQVFVLALIGGILGVLFMIPLRRSLIVKEHGKLVYPEGQACADVLITGEKGGGMAKILFYGIGLAFLYKLLMGLFHLWQEIPSYVFSRKSSLPNGSVAAEISPELLGVGYIIGPRIAGIMVAGGVLSYLVLIPLITLIGDQMAAMLPSGTTLPVSEMGPDDIRATFVKYIGAGAVTFGGIMTLIKTMPTIVSAFSSSIKSMKGGSEKQKDVPRTERDIPMIFVVLGSLLLIIVMSVLPGLPTNWLTGIMIVVFGFFFVTVSSRIVGLIGSSSNPISGMTIATLMATCLVFIGMGWTGDAYQPVALCVGAMVCIAAANAGATSQDLKTGYIVGATPVKQQIGLLIGVGASVIAIGFTLMLMVDTFGVGDPTAEHPNPLPAPQANLMATIIKGLLGGTLPWGLIVIGMAIGLVVELCGISSLAFAVGAYLPLSASAPIFIGGVVKWLADKKNKAKTEESETGPGALFSSGLIAGGALTGILIAILTAINIGTDEKGNSVSIASTMNMNVEEHMSPGMASFLAFAIFLALGAVVFYIATKKYNENKA